MTSNHFRERGCGTVPHAETDSTSRTALSIGERAFEGGEWCERALEQAAWPSFPRFAEADRGSCLPRLGRGNIPCMSRAADRNGHDAAPIAVYAARDR